jgi:hypothetical protein
MRAIFNRLIATCPAQQNRQPERRHAFHGIILRSLTVTPELFVVLHAWLFTAILVHACRFITCMLLVSAAYTPNCMHVGGDHVILLTNRCIVPMHPIVRYAHRQ